MSVYLCYDWSQICLTMVNRTFRRKWSSIDYHLTVQMCFGAEIHSFLSIIDRSAYERPLLYIGQPIKGYHHIPLPMIEDHHRYPSLSEAIIIDRSTYRRLPSQIVAPIGGYHHRPLPMIEDHHRYPHLSEVTIIDRPTYQKELPQIVKGINGLLHVLSPMIENYLRQVSPIGGYHHRQSPLSEAIIIDRSTYQRGTSQTLGYDRGLPQIGQPIGDYHHRQPSLSKGDLIDPYL